MKRYISLIIICILTLGIMTFLFYLMLRQDSAYITYIKLQVNPSFVMGVNRDKKVVFYNALNSDGNRYNLAMFQGKELKEATKVFIEKLGSAKESKNSINITVMTKNNQLEHEIISVMEKAIKDYDNNYVIIAHEPTFEELEKYSNETIYNLEATLKSDDLKGIGRIVYQKVNRYVEDKIQNLRLDKLKKEERINILKNKNLENYFDDYELNNMKVDEYNVVLLEKSNYSVIFHYEDDLTYSYEIVLYLEVEYEKGDVKHIVENYTYTYELGEDKEILRNLNKYYYTF